MALDVAEKISAALYPSPHPMEWIETMELIVASHATVLCIVSRNPELLRDQELSECLLESLARLDRIVVSEKELTRFGRYREDYLADGALLVFVPATISMCQSLVTLAEADVLPLGDESAPSLLMHHLLETFGETEAFQTGTTLIQNFLNTRSSDRPISSTVNETVEKADEQNCEAAIPTFAVCSLFSDVRHILNDSSRCRLSHC